MNEGIKIETTVLVTLEQIRDQLVTRLEGPREWLLGFSPRGVTPAKMGWRTPYYDDLDFLRWMRKGGVVNIEREIVTEAEAKEAIENWCNDEFTWRRIENGLKLMAKDRPNDFADLISGNADFGIADTLFQLALFNEIVFG